MSFQNTILFNQDTRFAQNLLPEVRVNNINDLPTPSVISDGSSFDGITAHILEDKIYRLGISALVVSYPLYVPANTNVIISSVQDIVNTWVYVNPAYAFILSEDSTSFQFLNTVVNLNGTNTLLDVINIENIIIRSLILITGKLGTIDTVTSTFVIVELLLVNTVLGLALENGVVSSSIGPVIINTATSGITLFSWNGPGHGPIGMDRINIVSNPNGSLVFFDPILAGIDVGLSAINTASGNIYETRLTGAIQSFTDNGSGNTRVNSTGHGLAGTVNLYIYGPNGYRNIGYIATVITVDAFDIADDTGTPVPFDAGKAGTGTWNTGSLTGDVPGIARTNVVPFLAATIENNNPSTNPTTFSDPNTPTPVKGTYLTQDYRKIQLFSDGIFYIDSIDITEISVNIVVTAVKSAADRKVYNFILAKNGDPNDASSQAWAQRQAFTNDENTMPMTMEFPVTAGDYFQLYVENTENTDSLGITFLRMIVRST
jgi:hypothetical protein